MDLDKMVTFVKNDNVGEINNLLTDYSIRQKTELLDIAADKAIPNFAQILEAIIENTSESLRYQIMIHAIKIVNSDVIEETHILSILPVIYLSLNIIELATLTTIAEFLLTQICDGTGKNTMWTELLPRIFHIIIRNGYKKYCTSGDLMITGYNFRTRFVDKLIKSSQTWKKSVIPDISSMFKQGVPLTPNERYLFFDKLCNLLMKLDPSDLSTFSYNLFQASFEPKLFVGVLFSLDKYFRHHYWIRSKKPTESEPTQSSVMAAVPESSFRREEDVIISQIFYQLEYNFSEQSLTNALRETTMSPELILSPFIFESLICLTRINQTADVEKVSRSTLLTRTIHSAIKNNFEEMEIIKSSFYIRSLLDDFPKCMDLVEISRLIIYDSQIGLEVITPGLFGLAYSLLKNKKDSPKLHHLAAVFLTNFLHYKPLYTHGVFERLLTLMMRNLKGQQHLECLEKIIFSKEVILEACDYLDTLKSAFEDIPYMSSECQVNLMTVVLPLLRKSGGTTLRTLFINMLRRAMTSSDLKTQQVAVYGCGLFLKQLKYSELTDNIKQHDFTTVYLTGYTLLTQMTQMNMDNLSPHDMMTLEIMTILSKGFCCTYDVRMIMYKGLKKAAMENSKVLPHVIDFLNQQLKQFVDTDPDVALKMDALVEDNMEIVVVKDNVGVLTSVLVRCLVEADLKRIKVENVFLRDFLTRSIDKARSMTLESLDITPPFGQGMYIIASQFLNFMESIMAYTLWKATESNGYISKLVALAMRHKLCLEQLKLLANPKTGNKRKKESQFKAVQNAECMWDFSTLLRFLTLYYNKDNKGLTQNDIDKLKENEYLKLKVLKATADYVRKLRSEPAFLQIKNSRRHFQILSEVAKIAFDRLFYSSDELCCEETLLAFDIFKECISTTLNLFKRKFEVLINKMPENGDENFDKNVLRIVNQLTGMILKLCDSTKNKEFNEKSKETKLLAVNMSVIDMFVPYVDAGTPFCAQVYDFFYEFNTKFTMNAKSLGIALKMLFIFRQKAMSIGDFFPTVASLITTQYGLYTTKLHTVVPEKFALKSLTESTYEAAADHFLVSMRKYLDQNIFLLRKANSLIYRLTKIPGQKVLTDQILAQIREIERMTIALLTNVCRTMRIMSFADIPLGKVVHGFFRVLISMYSNGEKLARIFMNHNKLTAEELDFFELKELCDATRVLTRPVANFILHVDRLSTIAASNERISGKTASKMVLRDSRYIPKYVYWFEKFSIEVILLSKRTKQKFYELLHPGICRDFRLKADALIKTAGQTVVASQNSSDDFESISDDEEDAVSEGTYNSDDDFESTFDSKRSRQN